MENAAGGNLRVVVPQHKLVGAASEEAHVIVNHGDLTLDSFTQGTTYKDIVITGGSAVGASTILNDGSFYLALTDSNDYKFHPEFIGGSAEGACALMNAGDATIAAVKMIGGTADGAHGVMNASKLTVGYENGSTWGFDWEIRGSDSHNAYGLFNQEQAELNFVAKCGVDVKAGAQGAAGLYNKGTLGSSSKTSVTKPNETKMFRSALLYDVRKWCFFVRIIV